MLGLFPPDSFSLLPAPGHDPLGIHNLTYPCLAALCFPTPTPTVPDLFAEN